MKTVINYLKKNKILILISSFLLLSSKNALGQIDAMPVPLYGIDINPKKIMINALLWISSAFIILLIAPVVGLFWYKKKGLKRKWPIVVILILLVLFAIVTALIFTRLYL